MKPLDDMFRDGLSERNGQIPDGMWERVSDARSAPAPEGEALDNLFADALKDAPGQVPADMWGRIAATGVPAPALIDQTFRTGLGQRTAAVPAGLWTRIWAVRTAAQPTHWVRWAAVAASLLLLLGVGVLMMGDGEQSRLADYPLASSTSTAPAAAPDDNDGAIIAYDSGEGVETVVDNMTAVPEDVSTGTADRSDFRDGDIPPSENADETVVTSENDPAVASLSTGTVADENATNTAREQLSLVSEIAEVAVAPLVVATPELTVKRQYLPRHKLVPKETFRAHNRHRLQTEFLFGAFYANQSFTAATDEQRDLREARNLNENADLSYQVTLRGSLNLNRRFHLLGGLTYAEIRNEFAYTQVTNGTPRDIVTTNQLRLLEAPLLLGLRMPGRRMMVSLNAGPLVNLAFGARGRFIDPDAAQPLDLKTNGNYRKNVGVGLMSSLSINYQLGKKEPFLLLVEPFFKSYPGAFTVADAPLKESYWAAGVQFGIRKGF